MPDSYSVDVQRVIASATTEARRLGHTRLGTEHLLLGLLADDITDAAEALEVAGVTLAAARHTVAEVVGAGEAPAESPNESQSLPLTPRAQRALERAGRFSRRDREPEVTPTYVLLGVLDVEGLACQVLRGLGVDIARLRQALAGTEPEVDVIEVAPAPADQQPAQQPVRPRCPACGVGLDGNLGHTTVKASGDDARQTFVGVAYCASCGSALGVLAAESP